MSLLTSLTSGTSGLSSASSELAVIGDNIANANTVGFKSERAVFEDQLAQSVVGGSGQIGLGSHLQAVTKTMTQGSLTTTGVATDLALQGDGFFEVAGTAGDGRTGTYLTRAGQFTVSAEGYLVNQAGLRVQGYGADTVGNLTGALGDLQVGNATSQPFATAGVTVRANLDASATAVAFDPNDPSGTSNFSTSTTVYDSLGASHQVQIYYSRTAAGWDWNAMTDGGGVAGGTAGTPVRIATGNVTFDAQGRLTSFNDTSGAAGVAFNPLNATNPQPLAFNFGTPSPGGTGLDGITQFAGSSVSTFVGQDGFASGQLSAIQIDRTGTIQGVFSNGETRALGQVAVAKVPAPEQLERMGGNLYAQTRDSGEPVLGSAGQGGRGYMSSGALEQSNVDIAEQFVRMIAAQRAFQANSKTITTSDQLLAELIQLKR
jgi:flagellar hook protein FlgE